MSVQRFNKANTDTQPFHLYYDMNVINNDSSFPAEPVRFQYKETRSNYFLLSPQDYFMSIVRFNLQTPTLPVFIPQVNLNPNTNLGGVFPIQSMNGNFSSSVVSPPANSVNLYTNVIIPVGAVIYLGLSGGGITSIYETSNTYHNYYRVLTSGSTAYSTAVTTLQIYNPFPVNPTGVGTITPANYAGGTVTVTSPTSPPVANQIRGGTISVALATLPIANLVYASNLLTLTYTSQPNLVDLQYVYNVGDSIVINNASQYNGVYTIQTVNALSLVLNAPTLATITTLNPYVLGGLFMSNIDFYNVTPYKVTLTYKDQSSNLTYSYSSQVIYVPNDLTATPPIWNPSSPQALSLADVTSPYYYVYNYEVFINMVNQALTNAFWGLNGYFRQSVNGVLPMSSTTNSLAYQPPSMSWNQSNLTAILTGDNSAFSQGIGFPIYMYFNQPLSTLFDSFPYQYPNVNPDSSLYSYVVFNTNAGAGLYVVSAYSNAGVITPQYTAIQVYQDHQTASLMNPIQSIVFSSTILPVVMEQVGTPLILNGTSANRINIGSTANVFPVVTDFIVPFSATNGYVPDVSYVPSGEYRLVDLYGESPANQIDIQVYWKDQYGLIHPFLLGSGCSGSLKIMFRRKDYADVTLQD